MKTVSGKVTSTIPISLSDAAKSLSKFASSNHEASHAVSLYLERAADSFNHLVKVHQKLSPQKEHSKDDIRVDEASESKKNLEDVVKNVDIPNGSRESNKSKNLVKEADTRRSKTKNSAKNDDQKLIKTEERVDIGEGETEKSKKNELKMEPELKGDGITSKDKKRKKKNRGVGDSEQEVGIVEEDLGYMAEEEGKKRKNLDLDAGEHAGSTERSSKKKSKKRRVEGEK